MRRLARWSPGSSRLLSRGSRQAASVGSYLHRAAASASAAWARFIARTIRRWAATSRSRSCPQHFTSDPERLARFEREARVLAALNHPHIARHLWSGIEADGVRALVLELVEGDTLADRIDRGPLPVSDALRDRAVRSPRRSTRRTRRASFTAI